MAWKWQRKDTLLFLTILFSTFFLRLLFLGDRPLHHDESLHGAYSLYYFSNSLTGFYKYDPLLHGPLLYHIVPWFYWILGISKFSVRLPAVILSTTLLFIPYLLKRYITRNHFYLFLLFIALGPTFTYWSRFLRHDNFVFFCFVLGLFALKLKKPFLKSSFMALAFSLHLSAKENFYIHLLFLLAYLVFEYSIVRKDSLLDELARWIKINIFATALGLVLFGLISTHYYSAGFVYGKGIEDLITGKAFRYWFEQHQRERIAGPFSFPFLINSLYEAWWIPFLVFHYFSFYKKFNNLFIRSFIPSLIIATLLFINSKFTLLPSVESFCQNILKVKIPFDYFLFFLFLPHGVSGTYIFIKRKQRYLAISHFLFFASLFTYSFLGEKVPWLALYPALFGLIYFMLSVEGKYTKTILFLLLVTCYQSYLTNLKYPSSPQNLLTQVHTSIEFERNILKIQNELHYGKSNALIRYDSIWPTTWYLYNHQGFHYASHLRPSNEYDYILTTTYDNHMNQNLKKDYTKEIIPLRSWWLPNYEDLTMRNALIYFLTKKPWGKVGHQYIALWKRTTLPKGNIDK